MFKQKWITKTDTTATAEIGNWMKNNCGDFFDDITVSTDTINCIVNQITLLSIVNNSDALYIRWKGRGTMYGQNNARIRCVYRTTNAILFTILPSSPITAKYIPAVGIIKTTNDYFFIACFASGSGNEYNDQVYMPISTSDFTFRYKVFSYNDGDGSLVIRTTKGYYSGNNQMVLSPIVASNGKTTPLEIAYWIESGMNRDVGVITINGHEYFSNGVFCILNE